MRCVLLPALAAGVLGAALALSTYSRDCTPVPGVSLCMGLKLYFGYRR